ncbi:UDP-N-acetylmuramoyl-tripeptide--D-alanyl-D-alanine ligase [Patescibacteria group bacterium]|nr:UDP-N-acetylmuramoyl-tripeptide--D-alanyl-D-alanine ligase [Patescibacteria group bacterium]
MDFFKQSAKEILRYEARLVLKKYKPKIIVITGSVGKTSTKEAVFSVLSKRFFIRKSEKSFTADLGIPMTIIGCPDVISNLFELLKNLIRGLILLIWKTSYPELLILEIDGDKPGDIPGVADLIVADLLLMTAIGEIPAHIEAFSDLEVFIAEKRSILNTLDRTSTIIYNADDKTVFDIVLKTECKKVSCGIGSGSEISGSEFQITYGGKEFNIPTGMTFDISFNENKYPITVYDTIGVNNEYAFLLAFATGIHFGITEKEILSSLSKFKPIAGRMRLINGNKDTIVVDDSYNSSPIAMNQALSAFKQLKTSGKKIIVVGDMLELGKYSAEEHKKIAEQIKGVSFVICVGIRARKIVQELLKNGFNEASIISVDNSEEASIEIEKILEKGDAVLIKGSQSIRLEKVVEEIMRHPEDKEKLLVRQEERWQTT